MKKKILYIDMDNVLVDFQSGIDQLNKETLRKYKGRMDEVPGIFCKMLPINGAIDSFTFLFEHFDTYILSTTPWNNPTAGLDKLAWVKKYIGDKAHKRLILSHHKNLNKGDFLIDDRTKNGAGEFQGELIQFGSEKFPGWKEVVEYLMERKESD
jgi:5'-nucleotidase